MPKKYHITPEIAAPRFIPVGRSGIIDWEEDCLKCTTCVKKRCLYDVYSKRSYDALSMVDSIDYQCKNCFYCIQNCPRGVLSKTINPEFLKMGDEYWKPEMIISTWFQAETGKIPVSGAGYRGPFSGHGFDSMWTDMSEIVRPTRDGIHGREYISTAIDIGRKKNRLEFSRSGEVMLDFPPLVEIPLPILFNVLPFGNIGKTILLAMAKAAKQIGAMMYLPEQDYDDYFSLFIENLIILISQDRFDERHPLLKKVKIAELYYSKDTFAFVSKLKKIYPGLVVSVRVPMDEDAKKITTELARADIEAIHLYADFQGNEFCKDAPPRFIKDVMRDIHCHLVDLSLRDEITLIASGGIALAEHLPKVLICGADCAAIDLPLLIAMECRVCKRCVDKKSCPVELEKLPLEHGVKRVVNLMCSW